MPAAAQETVIAVDDQAAGAAVDAVPLLLQDHQAVVAPVAEVVTRKDVDFLVQEIKENLKLGHYCPPSSSSSFSSSSGGGPLRNPRASSHLTRRTLQLAADFHLHTVAEGVEEVEQLDILRGFGCDAVQGFLFARPQPIADIVRLLGTGLTQSLAPAGLLKVPVP